MKKTDDSRALFEGLCMDDADCIYSRTLYPQAQAAFEKIEKYWNIVDRTPAYYASMILDPRQKKKWFRKHWTNDIEAPWLQSNVERLVSAMWEEGFMDKFVYLQAGATYTYEKLNKDDL
jgi:hypothetical protein